MCRTHDQARDQRQESAVYTGETSRLGRDGRAESQQCRWGGFPWWSLWLIWPLVVVLKHVGPLAVDAIGAIYAYLSAAGGLALPIALIALGIALLRRAPRTEMRDL